MSQQLKQQQQHEEDEKKEIEELDKFPEMQKEQEHSYHQDECSTPEPKKKIKVCIWWVIWILQCSEVLVLQLAQTYQFPQLDDSNNICSMNIALNLLRLMLISITLFVYTPLKIFLNRYPLMSASSEISMVMLSAISLLSSLQSVYITLIIPTLRITFQLCNITSTAFKQKENQHERLIRKGFVNLQFFIFMNGVLQACPIFVAFLTFDFFFQMQYLVLVSLLGAYFIMFIIRFYLQNKFEILESGEESISEFSDQQLDSSSQTLFQQFWIIFSTMFNLKDQTSSNNPTTKNTLFLSYFFCFVIIFLTANAQVFSQNETSANRIYSPLYIFILSIVYGMIKLLTVEDTLNTIIIFIVFFNSSSLFLVYYFEQSIFFQIFQTIVSALSSCVPSVAVNYFDQQMHLFQLQQQHYSSLAFFGLSQFIQLICFSFNGIGRKYTTIFSITLSCLAIPMIYILRQIRRRRKIIDYQGITQLDEEL